MSSGVSGGLQAAIKGHVFRPSDPGFAEVARVFNTRFDQVTPHAVARPINGPDVRAAVRFPTEHGVSVRARSGGHSYAGYSTLADGVVLDLGKLNWVNFASTKPPVPRPSVREPSSSMSTPNWLSTERRCLAAPVRQSDRRRHPWRRVRTREPVSRIDDRQPARCGDRDG